MTVEEVEALGGSMKDYSTSGCNEKYPWVNTISYWLGSAWGDGWVWFVNDCLEYDSYGPDGGCEVRPVIEVFKSSIN